jgi:hypothetical protein
VRQVREMGAKGSLRVCSVETARDEGVVTFAVSAACMDLIKEELRFSEESQPLLYGLDEEEEISMTPKIIPVMSNNTINRMLSHEGLGRVRARRPFRLFGLLCLPHGDDNADVVRGGALGCSVGQRGIGPRGAVDHCSRGSHRGQGKRD